MDGLLPCRRRHRRGFRLRGGIRRDPGQGARISRGVELAATGRIRQHPDVQQNSARVPFRARTARDDAPPGTMIVFLNGQFVPAEQAVVSVFDRSFLYGDGLFETMPVHGGRPFSWSQHLERLTRGAEFLKIRLPFPLKEMRKLAGELIERNQMPNALLRLTLSRG